MQNLLISGFHFYLLQSGCRISTVENRIYRLSLFFKSYDDLSYDNAIAFISSLSENKRSATYINNFIFAFRKYTDFLKDTGKDYDDKVYTIKELVYDAPEKGILTDEEINRILSLPPDIGQDQELYYKYIDFFKILAYSGCRPNEICTLKPENVDLGNGMFTIESKFSKTHDSRVVPICSYLRPVFEKRLKENLFPDIDRGKYHYQFSRLLKRCHIRRRHISVYSLRHSFITSLLSNSNNAYSLFTVKAIVGHKSSQTTENYFHLNYKLLKQCISNLGLMKDKIKDREKISIIKEFINNLNLKQLSISEDGHLLIIQVKY